MRITRGNVKSRTGRFQTETKQYQQFPSNVVFDQKFVETEPQKERNELNKAGYCREDQR